MPESISVAEAKSRLSELLGRAAYGRERFLIRRRGRPVGAIVSAEDLARLEASERAAGSRGLLGAVGALAEFEEWETAMDEVIRSRAAGADREVELE